MEGALTKLDLKHEVSPKIKPLPQIISLIEIRIFKRMSALSVTLAVLLTLTSA